MAHKNRVFIEHIRAHLGEDEFRKQYGEAVPVEGEPDLVELVAQRPSFRSKTVEKGSVGTDEEVPTKRRRRSSEE